MFYKTLGLILMSTFLVGCETLDFDDWMFQREQVIPISEVPSEALAAAKRAVAGIELSSAEVEEEDGQRVYELAGSVGGQDYEIEVTSAGEILEVESEDD